MKSGGGSSNPPRDAQPQGPPVTPYGQASPFNPQFQSILPMGPNGEPDQTQTAMLTDPTYQEEGQRTPLLDQQQQAAPLAAQGMGQQNEKAAQMKELLAKLILSSAQGRDQGFNVARGPHGVG